MSELGNIEDDADKENVHPKRDRKVKAKAAEAKQQAKRRKQLQEVVGKISCLKLNLCSCTGM